ncbi:MAG: hypothetical protein ACYCT1_11710 [Steroidobacteraceae bacterium]
MKIQIALLGCLLLAWRVASANVNCAQAPYGESVVQFGRDEFRLGMIAAAHNDAHRSVRQAVARRVNRAMRAACRAKFHDYNLARYAGLGLTPHSLKTQSVGAIAALTVTWSRPSHRGSGRIAPASSGFGGSPATGRRTALRGVRHVPSAVDHRSVVVTSNFPACPRRVDFQTLLSAALIDRSDWPKAQAKGRRHGCIVLRAGERVHPLRSETWSGLIQVRPDGHTKTYWTATVTVK